MVATAEKASLMGSVSSLSLLCLVYVSLYRCNSLAFRTSVLMRLFLDLDTYGGVDPLGVFSLFLKKVANIIAQKRRIVFRILIRL